MNVFELFATLGLDTTAYDKGLEGAESSASSFGSKLKTGLGVAAGVATTAVAATTAATVAGTKAFVEGITATAQYGDQIDKTSQKLGFSAEKYQQLDYALNLAGTSMSNMSAGIKTLTNQLDNARNGSEEAIEKFEQIGISLEDIQTMSREDLFEKAIMGFQNLEDSTERAALANDIFGRAGQELGPLFNMTADQMQEAIDKASEYGMVMSDEAIKASAGFQDQLTTLQGTLTGFKNNMLSDFLPAASTAMAGLSAIFSGTDVEGGLSQIEEGIKGVADNLIQKAPQLMQIGGTILNALLTSITTNLPVLLNAAVPVIMELANGLISAAPQIITAAVSLIGTIGSALGDPANLENLLESAVTIILTISDAISQNAETVIPAVVEIIMQMLTALTDEKVLMPLLSAGLSVITSVVSGILKAIPVLIKNLPAIIDNITKFLIDSTPLIIQAAIQLLGGIIEAIPTIIVELVKSLPQIITSIVNGLLSGTSQLFSVGEDLIRGLWNGISNMSKWIGEKIKGFGEGVVSGLKSFFGIASPSKLFRDEIGQMLALGLGEGFEEGMDKTMTGMEAKAQATAQNVADALAEPINSFDASGSYSLRSSGATSGRTSSGGAVATADEILRIIDARLSKMEFTVPVYIGGKKIDQQVVTASARAALISGGR